MVLVSVSLSGLRVRRLEVSRAWGGISRGGRARARLAGLFIDKGLGVGIHTGLRWSLGGVLGASQEGYTGFFEGLSLFSKG